MLLGTLAACNVYAGKLWAGYRLYVAAVINAALLRFAHGVSFTHDWFRDLSSRAWQRGWFYKQRRRGGWQEHFFVLDEGDGPPHMSRLPGNPQTQATASRPPQDLFELTAVWMSDRGNLWLLHQRAIRYVRRCALILLGLMPAILAIQIDAGRIAVDDAVTGWESSTRDLAPTEAEAVDPPGGAHQSPADSSSVDRVFAFFREADWPVVLTAALLIVAFLGVILELLGHEPARREVRL